MRFHCTSAHVRHVIPRHGAPKLAQNYVQTQADYKILGFYWKYEELQKNDPNEMFTVLYRGNGPLAALGAPLVIGCLVRVSTQKTNPKWLQKVTKS